MKSTQEYNAMSNDELTLERNQLEPTVTRMHKLRTVLYSVACVGLVVMAIGLFDIPKAYESIFKSFELYNVFFTAGLAAIATLVDTLRDVRKTRLMLLTPLSASSHCSSTLEMVETSPQAQKLLSDILATGRQLYVFDYEAICECVKHEELRDAQHQYALKAQKEAEACRKLHGIAA